MPRRGARLVVVPKTNKKKQGKRLRGNKPKVIGTEVGLYRPPRNELGSLTKSVVNPRITSRRRRKNYSGLPQVVAAYIDPFDEAAYSVRYPDSYLGMSSPFTGKLVRTINTSFAAGGLTDLNLVNVTPLLGSSLFCVTPDPEVAYVQGICGVQAGGAFGTIPGTFFWPNGILFTAAAGSLNAFSGSSGVIDTDSSIGNMVQYRAQFSGARLVAGGVKIFSVQNFATISGTIHIAPIFIGLQKDVNIGGGSFGGDNQPLVGSMANGWQCQLPANLEIMSAMPGYVQFPMSALEEDEVVCIFSRYGDEAKLFKPTGQMWGTDDSTGAHLNGRRGQADNSNGVGHYAVCVFVDGCTTSSGGALPNATPLLNMEWIGHYEAQPSGFNVFATNTTLFGGFFEAERCKSAPHQPLLMAAADNISADIPTVRCIDAAGVEESDFLTTVSEAFKSSVKIATSIAGAVDVIGPMLSALVL